MFMQLDKLQQIPQGYNILYSPVRQEVFVVGSAK
jgi:hypothetical protein